MNSPTWSVYDGEWGESLEEPEPPQPEMTLRGCGLRRKCLIQRGAQGAVYMAEDATGNRFAVKRFFTQCGDFGVRGVADGALREVTLLHHISAKAAQTRGSVDPGVVRLHRVVEAPHQELCLVLEHCPLNLGRLILRKKPKPHSTRLQPLAPARCPVLAQQCVVQFLLREILRVLCFLHDECGVIHRDVKPSNLLVQADGTLRLCDFGSARFTHHAARAQAQKMQSAPPASHKSKEDTDASDDAAAAAAATDGEYTPATLRTTVIYQSHEALLGDRRCSAALDVWAAGVVFGEILLQQHLFNASSELLVLSAIWKLLGTPPASDNAAAEPAATFAVASEPTIGLKFPETVVSGVGLDLLKRMLHLDPLQRISAAEALRHPFLQLTDNAAAEARALWQEKVKVGVKEAVSSVTVAMPTLLALENSDEDEDDDEVSAFLF